MSGFKPYDASSSGGGGGGGVFQPEQRFVEQINSGVTGDIKTITAASGKVIKITYLAVTSSFQEGISLIVNGNTFINNTNINNVGLTNSANSFAITRLGDASAGKARYVVPHIYCTSFVMNKDSGNTSRIFYLNYEIGEVK